MDDVDDVLSLTFGNSGQVGVERITDYGFHAFGTNINVDIVDGPSTWPTQVFVSADDGHDSYHRVSFKQRHDEADIVIHSSDVLGLNILQMEWRGTYFKTGRRF